MTKQSQREMKSRSRKTMRMVTDFALQLWWLNKTKFLRSEEKQNARQSAVYAAQAKRFRLTATELGGLLIKLGQHISVRIDLLPKEYTEELTKLQDSVAAVDTKFIIEEVEQELGRPVDELFARFDESPLAAASLAQVHEATLPGGQRVAVKALRPGIDEIINTDLGTLKAVIALLKRRTKIAQYADLDMLYQEFAETISNELDLVREGQSAETVQRNLLENIDVSIPQIFWNYTSHKVLTMEFMEGTKINDIEALNRLGVDKDAVARKLLDIYLQMILEDGFFHADPHPGNVLVGPDDTIILLDFGMMGSVTQKMRDDGIELVTALFLKDSTRLVTVLRDLGFIRKNLDTEVFEVAVSALLDRVIGGNASATIATLEGSANELREFMYSQPFQLPGNVTFLGKALFTVVGLCVNLNPKIDFIEEVRPLAEGLFGEGFSEPGTQGFLDQAKQYLKTFGPALLKIPTLINRMESGKLSVRLETEQTREFQSAQNAGTQKIVRTIIGAALFLSGVYLVVQPSPKILAWTLVVFGALIMLIQTRPIRPSRKRRRRHPGT